ncbi:RluA family pseudouridine synthase [Longimicrobium sp.]|jgi:RluA family pseudouridine synthase|uniref:RluA family pseudouridine synthase n=1 Tax=Longimicrobium sp. TaxID=2029185 RepID=UPI002F94A35F
MPEQPRNQPQHWVKHTVSADEAGGTVQDILTKSMGVSRRMIQRLTRTKGVQLNRRPAWVNAKVREGDVVTARLADDEESGLVPVQMPLDVVLEDAELLVLNKPPHLLVHPTSPEHRETLSHGVAWHLARQGVRAKVRPAHRIDRDTSGLVLFAKSAHAHHRLDLQLREGGLKREYLALVDGVIGDDRGVIDQPIARDPRNPALRAVRPGGEHAVTRYTVVERFPAATLLRVELETGRTHQIRVHMLYAGHAVLGDRQYGRKGLALMPRQALHASRLAFTHPSTGEPVEVVAELPEDIRGAIERLNGEAARG